jgi:hypothetical protein
MLAEVTTLSLQHHSTSMSLLDLDEVALACVLCQLVQPGIPHDLLRLGRTCSRLHEAVQHTDCAWQQLYRTTYSSDTVPSRSPLIYRRLFISRWVCSLNLLLGREWQHCPSVADVSAAACIIIHKCMHWKLPLKAVLLISAVLLSPADGSGMPGSCAHSVRCSGCACSLMLHSCSGKYTSCRANFKQRSGCSSPSSRT